MEKRCRERIREIRDSLQSHIGQLAILSIKSGRKVIPYLVKLVVQGGHCIGRYACYNTDGSVSTHLSHVISIPNLLTGEQSIRFLDEGI